MQPHGGERRFHVDDLAEVLDGFLVHAPDARWHDDERCFRMAGAAPWLRLPRLAPEPLPRERLADYALRDDLTAGTHALLLLRAGASALGVWHGHELLRHKAFKRYVVRGSGKAQPTHLKTKGKSRYGSRLRLQNWERLLGETSERLHTWWREIGPPARMFVAMPVRLRAEFAAADPAPPFGMDDPLVRAVPFHVHEPDHAELLRVHGLLGSGAVHVDAATD